MVAEKKFNFFKLSSYKYFDPCLPKQQQVRKLFKLRPWAKINGKNYNFAGKWYFFGIRKGLNLDLKAEKQVQNQNHTNDWALPILVTMVITPMILRISRNKYIMKLF